jgi:hypothetical protein
MHLLAYCEQQLAVMLLLPDFCVSERVVTIHVCPSGEKKHSRVFIRSLNLQVIPIKLSHEHSTQQQKLRKNPLIPKRLSVFV